MTRFIPTSIAGDIIAFHDRCTANRGWAKSGEVAYVDGLWHLVELNHRYNNLLWDEEDLARRNNVDDGEIAANKRAIDGYNQKRNNAIEQIDEFLLLSLGPLPKCNTARLNSETAGSIIDRMSILSLKIFHMGLQLQRTDVDAVHVDTCQQKQSRLYEQRIDLGACLDTLLADCIAGLAYFKIYRQFKMYNDPTLNPYLYSAGKT